MHIYTYESHERTPNASSRDSDAVKACVRCNGNYRTRRLLLPHHPVATSPLSSPVMPGLLFINFSPSEVLVKIFNFINIFLEGFLAITSY